LPELNVSALDWVGGVKGYFGGSNLYVTTNFGASWQIMSAPGTGNFISIEGTYNNLWCLRPDNKIYNLDSLNNWNISYTPPNGNITMMKNIFTYMFSLRDNGGISRRVITGGPLGITQLSNIIPKSFSLSQNYPNPFNPSTKIKFQITKLGNAKLVIYDALGREVSTLVNEQLQPGIYESELDGSNFPSGVYFYQLTVNSEQLTKFTETKKLVLIK
jgi:hypothetical protein